MEPWAIILLVAAGALLALWLVELVVVLCIAALVGAICLLTFASQQGFVGLAVYVACWVFLFPLMLVASIAIGLFVLWAEKRDERRRTFRQRLGYDE